MCQKLYLNRAWILLVNYQFSQTVTSTYSIRKYVIWSVNLPLLQARIIFETLQLPDFYWELSWEETRHVHFFPCAVHKTGFVASLTSSSLLKLVQKCHSQRNPTERINNYWVVCFLAVVMQGSKTRAVLNMKRRLGSLKLPKLFLLIFHTFSAGLFSRVFCQTKLSSEVTPMLWRTQWGQRGKWISWAARCS